MGAARISRMPKPDLRISDEAVQSKTGRTWKQWFALLDKAGGKKLDHKSIVALVKAAGGASAWWQQGVTVAYEQARGLRKKNEMVDGFAASVSRVMPLAAAELRRAFEDGRARAKWLGEKVTLKTKTARGMLRLRRADGTDVEVTFAPKGEGKSQVVVQQRKLPNALASRRAKKFWADALGRMRAGR